MRKGCLIAGLVVCVLALGSAAAWVSSRAEIETRPSSFTQTPPGWEPVLRLAPGDVIQQYPSAGDNPTGIEFDETNRVFYQGAWDGNIYELDTNMTVIAAHPHFGDQSMPATGLAWYHGLLYQCNYMDGLLYQIDVSTWTQVGTVPSPGGAYLMGVEFVGDRMWLTDDDMFLYECDTLGTQINSYASTDAVPFGMAYLPGLDSIWLCGWSGGQIYAVDLATGTQYARFPTPGSGGAFSCSGASFDDRYPVYLWIPHQTDAMLYLTDTGNLIGLVTGGGWIPGGTSGTGTRRTFGFNAQSQTGPTVAQLQFVDHATKLKVHSDTIHTLVIQPGDTIATFSGYCRVDGLSGYSFLCEVMDRGEPGRGVDWFSLDVYDGDGNLYYSAGDYLGGGNIQIHRPDSGYVKGGAEADAEPGDDASPPQAGDVLTMGHAPPDNSPSAFTDGTTITFHLPSSGHATLEIYDITGRLVATPIDRQVNSGPHTATWNTDGPASGIYFYRLQFGDKTDTRKMVLLR